MIAIDLKSKIVRTTIVSSLFLLAFNIANPYLTPFLLSKGFLKQEIAYFSAFAPLVLIFLSSIIGNISDNIGRKRTINFSIFLIAFSYLILLLMGKNYFLLALSLLLITISYEAVESSSIARVEDNVEDNNRGKATGKYETFRTIGALFGTAIGSCLVSISNIDSNFKVAVSILFFLFVLGLLRKSKNHNHISRNDFNFAKDIKDYLKNKQLRGVAIVGIGANFIATPRNIFIPILLIQDLHANLVYVGIFSLIMAISHLSQYYFGKKCDINGSSKLVKTSILLVSFLIMLPFFANSTLFLLILAIFIGLAGSAWNVSALCYMSKIGEKMKEEGRVVGSYSSLAYIGVFLGLVSSGYISQVVSTRAVFLFLGVIGFISYLFAHKYIKD